ncbi:hypothetical protein V1503_14060 [Bacillus sp. SCS-151]|uniref:hypothetical protein n=1 Tax=Nanhaiella sioensis TaxID=3115293 RepID=UPI0039797F45
MKRLEEIGTEAGQIEMRSRLVQPRQALESMAMKAIFAFVGIDETTREARRRSWTD